MSFRRFSLARKNRGPGMRLVLLGLGQVGLSLLEILQEKRFISGNTRFELKAVADTTGVVEVRSGTTMAEVVAAKKSGGIKSLAGWLPGKDVREAVKETDADVLVDCTTTNFRNGQPSIDCFNEAIAKGMDIVTANKGPLAFSMKSIIDGASRKGVTVRYGATVGGGTPFIDFGRICASAYEIVEMRGVLNGTTNYILTRMDEGMSLENALEEARSSGLAETDPSNDLRGLDSAAKIVILANTLCGCSYSVRDAAVKGIDTIEPALLAAAKSQGKSIKLISTYGKAEGRLAVAPEIVSISDHVNVSGAYNALTYRTADGNEYTLIGTGAGATETARAVLRDLLSLPRLAVK